MSLVRYDSGPRSGTISFSHTDLHPFDSSAPRKCLFVGDRKFANETENFIRLLCGEPERHNIPPQDSELSIIAHGLDAIAASKSSIRQEDMASLLTHISKFVPGRTPVEVAELWSQITTGTVDTENGHVPQVASFRVGDRFKFSVSEDNFVCINGFNTIVMMNLSNGSEQKFKIEGAVDIVACNSESALCLTEDSILRLVRGSNEPHHVQSVKPGLEKIVCNSSIDPFFAAIGPKRLVIGKDFEIAEEELVGELVSVEVRGNRLFVATQKQIIVVDDMSDMTVVEAQISAFCVNWNGTVMVGCKGSEVMLYEVQNCEVWSVETVTCDVSVKSCKLSDGGLLALSDGATISVYDVRNLSAPVHHVFGKAPIHFEWMCERPLLMFVNEGELRISHVDGEKGSQVVYAKELMSRQVTKVLCTREMVFLESKRSIEIVRWNSRAIPILKL